ncbi:MAG: type II toxin-antitoxin system RelE/ParE family toxin [Rhodomicrobium sp.]|jgi:proteic killer suppression protein|nr:type II toxin-antitoxin system RelE/ParE family toxin [Rhodomicrobium sp.]
MDIYSIRHRGLRKFLEKNDPSGLPQDRIEKIRRIVTALSSTAEFGQLQTMPGWRLHPLKGDRAGYWAMSLSGNWRVTFRVEDDGLYDLDLEDYH